MIFLQKNHACIIKKCQVLLVLFLVTTICSSTTYYVNAQAESQHEYILEFPSISQTNLFIKNNEDDIIKVRYTYDSDLLTGTAVEFKNEKIAKKLVHDHPDIVRAWPIHHRIRQQAPITTYKNNKNSDSTNIYAGVEDDDSIVTFVPQNNDTLRILTQANNKYKSLKSNGAGIKIGIIDSGVDYTLPALGGCFGNGCKIAYGYDLVGNDFDGSLSSIKESDNPMDDCPANSTSATGHGTFVTGIIAAEDKEYNWNGVAPGATIGMWKVYGCKSSTAPNDILIKAMEMAYKAKMDVISISLGVSGGWEEDVMSVVADRLVAKGIHVITASGNIGTSGNFLTASPATGKNVIAAGSTMNDFVPGYILKLFKNDQTTEIPYRTYVNSPLVLNDKLPVVLSSNKFNANNDACEKLTTTTHHKSNHSNSNKFSNNDKFNNSIVLIHEGGCDPLIKIMHARDAGAKAVVIYTDIKNATTNFYTLSTAVLPVAFINNDDGEMVFKAAANTTLNGQFTNILVAMEAPETDVDSVSSFSSLGPTNELDLKPELMAVGGNVFSTLPRYLNNYGFRSGTSFSTPFIAGTVALLLSNTKQDTKPDLVKNILMNFASQVKDPISAVHYGDSPIRQGAGVVDVVQSIGGYEQFHVSPAKLSLNDTANFIKEHEITVYNHNTEKDLVFHISHQPSLTATGYSLTNQSDFTPVEPIGLYARNDSVASVHFSDTKLVVRAGESAQVRVRIQPPNDVFTLESHALYGGYIAIAATDNHQVATIPYFGMIGNMNDLPILDHSTNPSTAARYTFPSIGLENGNTTLKPDQVGHFHIQHKNDSSVIGGPYILTRLLTGTAILQIQILDKHDKIIGDVPMGGIFPRTYMMRNTLYVTDYSQSFYSWNWGGEYVPKDVTLSGSNGKHEPQILQSGEYRLKIRGLRVFGNQDNNKDWDEWISPKLMLQIDTTTTK